MFEQALLAGPRSSARTATFAVSMGAQMFVLSAALLLPLFLIEGPSVVRLNLLLMAPPPPPPPPAPMKLVQVPASVMRMHNGTPRLIAFTRVPTRVNEFVEATIPEAVDIGPIVRGGVPGGMGSPDGIPGGIGEPRLAPPPPAPAEPAKVTRAAEPPREHVIPRIRVGGGVQSAKLIHKVVPPYPPLAKAARIQGTVQLTGVLSKEGRIIQLQVLGGHPLLVQAALDAVRQWVYSPTLLNGEPVEVIAPIDVHFTLSN